MKHKLLALALMMFSYSSFTNAQNKCGFDNWVKGYDAEHSGYKEAMDANTQNLVNDINSERSNNFDGKIYTIRVVFHVVYRTAGEKTTYANMKKQIVAFNRDYSETNADRANMRAMFLPYASGDTRIRFELATTAPDGSTTRGYDSLQTTTTSFYSSLAGDGIADNVKKASTGGLDAWDPSKYLNIWSCNFDNTSNGGEIVGYATPPPNLQPYWNNGNSDPSLQGVVLKYSVIGDDVPASKGRTAVHEVGHYLGLRHVWGDSQPACGDDFIWDTPASADPLLGWSNCNGKNTVIRKFRVLPIGGALQYPSTYIYDTVRTYKLVFNLNTLTDDTVWNGQVRIDLFANAANATTVPDADSTSYFIGYPAGYYVFHHGTVQIPHVIHDTITGLDSTYFTVQVIKTDSFFVAGADTLINQTFNKLLFPNTCKMPSFLNAIYDTAHYLGDLPDFLENYMHYTDETCTVTFSNAQVSLMQGVLSTRRPGIATVTINGIEEAEYFEKLRFSPNPAQEYITLNNAPINATYQIINISGAIVLEGKLNSKTINISDISNGIYTVKVISNNKPLVNKLVISK